MTSLRWNLINPSEPKSHTLFDEHLESLLKKGELVQNMTELRAS